jgi:FAD/FMN-containing dehydrogenase
VDGDVTEQLTFGSWGGVFTPRQSVHAMRDRTAALPRTDGSVLPYGLGRSYGDSCLNDGNSLIRARDLDRFMAFDAASGVLRCEAGVLLQEIIELALPRGWFLPVTPGTKYVTVGGAIANDVHGKNHHRDGSIGHHVPRFEVLRSDGSRRECSADDEAGLYRATVGGLGLTGLITWAEMRLQKVAGPWITQRAVRFASLDEFFCLSEPLERQHQYVVAWLDCAARRASHARGILFAGDHAGSPGVLAAKQRFSFPFAPPFSLVGGLTLRAFNALYYRLPRPSRVTYDSFFYPLDGIRNWNRIYGRRGFFQYQCVVPEGAAGRGALGAILSRIGVLSFPRPGYSLALDFPNRGGSTLELLAGLDGLVAAAGGRVYPAKDARMSPQSFRAFYPEWEAFCAFVDPKFSSSFWRRVTGGAAMPLRRA